MDKTDKHYLLDAGRWLLAQGAAFRLGVVAPEFLPPADRVEIAFAGRSNVGKSTLLNALVGTKGLARASNMPGRTQELNFFMLAPQRGRGAAWLVDMPGYGYARESKAKIAAWNKLLTAYLRGRPNLRRVFVLVDCRHGLKKNDLAMMDDLDKAGVSYQIVLAKADKLKKNQLAHTLAETAQALVKRPAAHPEIIATSSTKGVGIDQLRGAIASLVDLTELGYKADRHAE